ncbi:MAG: sigma-70 family RNA polymerase sigma factor [Balneolaceae bacterium]
MFKWLNQRNKNAASYSTNSEWLDALRPPPEDEAITELRIQLVHGLRISLSKYVKRDLDHFVEDIAQDSILKILDKLETFRGESKFTTWAMKVAVREGYTELRKKRYKDISLDDHGKSDPGGKDAMEIEYVQPNPEQITHESMLVQKVMRLMDEELSEKQKKVLHHLMIDQIPMTVVAELVGSNRNAVYKMVHDARLKLKNRLEAEGINPDHLLDEM